MFTKEEASKLRQAFWTKFGQYMQPILSAEGLKTNWINYKTGVSGIYFKMDADKNQASIGISFTQGNVAEQAAQFAQMEQLKTMLRNALGEDWDWQPMVKDDYGKTISKVSKTITGVSIFRQHDWPALISFFKQRIIALDTFWSEAKYGFE
jgi:hypothetical protein